MQVGEVWIRFYKSFNFDYELKANPKAKRVAWQDTRNGWMPFIRVPLETDVTAVVGANESGKSHLLDAVGIVLTGEGILQRDFCRSSSLFSVEQDSRGFPEFGARLDATDSEAEALREAGVPLARARSVHMLRLGPEQFDVLDGDGKRSGLDADQATLLKSMLPRPHVLQTEIPLPDSVPIGLLSGTRRRFPDRKRRAQFIQSWTGLSSAEDAQAQASSLFTQFTEAAAGTEEAHQLGRDLLVKIARIDESSFRELEQAIAEEREGLVNALIQEMNNSIARHLNISRWWSQDPHFQLRVSPREHELVFTIRDRTGTDYSFGERSKGLRYFLSYYVQLLSHDRPDGVPEALLMDEPDAYLSASGQQDLLRVLEHYAVPDDSTRRDQVLYVTHSPFLINRNAGHRVRVLDKGVRDEGTRLVKDATQNHYEPLRTSLGTFVAETAFIGGDNLFVEGIADQVLLAGMNARLLRRGAAPSLCLDLNQVTIVAGGSHVPYMLYFARGRDEIKPACVVLLDGDKAGQEARAQIQKGGAHRRRIVADDLIVVLSEWAGTAPIKTAEGVVVEEIEDLVPGPVALAAARRYATTFLGKSTAESESFTEAALLKGIEAESSMWNAVEATFEAAFSTGISKAGFAKELLAYLSAIDPSASRPTGVPALDDNFAVLLEHLADKLRLAADREADSRRDQRLERVVASFLEDHPLGCKRDQAALALSRIDAAVDDTPAGDLVQSRTAQLRRDFHLRQEPMSNVDDYPGFLERLKGLRLVQRLSYQDEAN